MFSRLRHRSLRALAVIATAVATAFAPIAGTSATAARVPTHVAASAPSTLPTSCRGDISRIDPTGWLSFGGVSAALGVWSYRFGDTSMGGPGQAWTYSGFSYDGSDGGDPVTTMIAIGPDGLLWDISATDSFIGSSSPQPSAGGGWGSVRSLTHAGRSSLVYGLRGTALVRYGFAVNDAGLYVKSSRVMASTGWGGARKIASGGTATVNGRLVDTLYVITTAGALNLYTIDQATNTMRGYPLRSTGWQYVTQLNAERCTPTGGVTLVGILNGAAYLYRDPVSDATGDIISYGLITKGMSGTLYS